MLFLAQENFTGLLAFLFGLTAIFILISLLSLIFSACGRWYGPVMNLPGLLYSCLLTGALLKAMNQTPDVHWNPIAIILFASPAVLGLISIFVWSIQKSSSNSR